MVLTQKDIQEALATALAEQTKTISAQIDSSISPIRNEIINTLKDENKKLHERLVTLENKNDDLESRVIQLETKLEGNLQYQRNVSVIISGIPRAITHANLEGTVIEIFNKVCYHSITHRDIVACHRLSLKTDNVIVKFLNKKDAVALLGSVMSIKDLDKSFIPDCCNLYVNEHLTPYMSSVAYQCRCLKRSKVIYQTKVENGVVKILSNKDGIFKWFNIYKEEDINPFRNIEPHNVCENTDSH